MSNFLDTKHKRKSAVITSVIMSLLLVAIFFVGMKYLDPPEEYGIAINFGTSNVGSGNIQPKQPLKAAAQEKKVEEVKEEVETVSEPEVSEKISEVSEEVATQDNEEAIAIKKAKEIKRKEEEAERKAQLEKQRIEKVREDAIAKQKAEEAAKRKKLDALIGGINNSNGSENGGEGNDNAAG
ncbi:MAG: energy transducer TonB, partial [Lutibacter sp.]|nr:energy transducer TonB [Lutibacter sp.]